MDYGLCWPTYGPGLGCPAGVLHTRGQEAAVICDVVAVFSSSVVASGALDALGLGQARQTVKIQRKFLTAATQTVRTRAKSRLWSPQLPGDWSPPVMDINHFNRSPPVSIREVLATHQNALNRG
ncbi:hypothetical protein VTN96DRAFT_1520 [Rasamsonia emersonii]